MIVERLIDAAHVLVVMVLALRRGHIVVLPRRNTSNVRQRHQREQLRRRRVDSAGRNAVARKRQAGLGIDQLFAEEAEIAGPFLCGRDDRLARQAAVLTANGGGWMHLNFGRAVAPSF